MTQHRRAHPPAATVAGLAFALANGGLAWVLFRAVGRYRQAWLDMTLKLAINV